MLVARENLGVLLGADLVARLAGTDGVRLDALGGLQWFSCPRPSSPRWHDELAAILGGHGLDLGSAASADHFPIPSVMLAAVSAGQAFALVPQRCAEPFPETVAWSPIAGHSVVGRTWAVWLANSRRRDVAQLIAAFEEPDGA
jgi:DNA-binding transcriptional LysR family regulator